jgi:hypothetical protein
MTDCRVVSGCGRHWDKGKLMMHPSILKSDTRGTLNRISLRTVGYVLVAPHFFLDILKQER